MEANEGRWLPHGKHHGCGDGPHEAPWDIHDHHRGAPHCDDQLAVFSTVGRGLRGDGFLVRIKSDTDSETYLEGLVYDAATNEYHTEWVSENINGGKLMYQYNLRTFSDPQTFTITFRYVRPERTESEWVWTTPAIPYLWDADNNGVADVDGITGSGVATLFLKKTTDPEWVMEDIPTNYDYEDSLDNQEKLLYPEDWTREMFNAPSPLDPWTVNLEYGVGGDIDAPNIEDLAKILGISVSFIRRLVDERDLPATGTTFGDKPNGDPMDAKEYIDKAFDDALDHFHADLGLNSNQLAGDDNDNTNGWPYTKKYAPNQGVTTKYQTVKTYIDAITADLADGINASQAAADKANLAISNILNKIVGTPTMDANGNITWPAPLAGSNAKIAGGNINLYSGTNETISSAKGIFTHTGNSANDDLKAV